ncbi:MmcQ/YjbR family DNA-binding protein [Terrisporobacter sp.]
MINREEIFTYVNKKFNTKASYPWLKYPDYAVLRHNNSNKWYGLIMNVPKAKLNLKGEDCIDILNLKCDPTLIGSLRQQEGYLPAYHMNKEHWISIILDSDITKEEIYNLIDLSYDLTKK